MPMGATDPCKIGAVGSTPTRSTEVEFRQDEAIMECIITQGVHTMEDYLLKFMTKDGFDIMRLFDEDFLKAFKLCWNDRRYASAVKLLTSFIDTIAFLEFGDEPHNFQKWLDTYCELSRIGITSDELWEFRNSIVHMTNARSRKVLSGKVLPLVIYVGGVHPIDLPKADGLKPLGLWQLYLELEEGLVKWIESFNSDRTKLEVFIDRYDGVISDARYQRFEVSPELLNGINKYGK
jgi:hypothetical protein